MISFATSATLRLGMMVLLSMAGVAAAQQDYPNRLVRIVVAYPPGGSNDFLARLFSPKFTDLLGRQVIVDNRGGGNTIVGTDLVAKSTADGYTLLLTGSASISVPFLYRNVPYDIINDFTPVAGIARSDFMLVVHPALPVNSVRELVVLAKRKPGELNYATSSTGGATHLSAVQFEMQAGVKMQQVPYKGGGPAMADLIGGQVQLSFANPGSAVTLVKAGRLKAIAVTGETRLEALPQVPTFVESGMPGMVIKNWYGLTGPAGLPKVVVDKLSAATTKISAIPEIKVAIAKQGLNGYSATAEQLEAARREEMTAVAKIVKAANLKIQE